MKIIKINSHSEIPDNFTGIVEYEYPNGTRYFKEGKVHREDGPAVQWADGYKEWYKEDKLHRIDGPAVEYINGKKEWWVDGIQYAERDLEYFCKNCVFLGKEKRKHELVWLRFLDEDGIEEYPIVPGMDISELQRMENEYGI